MKALLTGLAMQRRLEPESVTDELALRGLAALVGLAVPTPVATPTPTAAGLRRSTPRIVDHTRTDPRRGETP